MEQKEDAIRLMVDVHLKYPRYLIFVVEVGNNISMKVDKRIGGEKKLARIRSRARETVSTKESHHTVLGFTFST